MDFDSKKEARRYDELMAMLRAGQIRDLKLQPQFTIQEAYTTPEGQRVRAIRYQADFSYERATEPDCNGGDPLAAGGGGRQEPGHKDPRIRDQEETAAGEVGH